LKRLGLPAHTEDNRPVASPEIGKQRELKKLGLPAHTEDNRPVTSPDFGKQTEIEFQIILDFGH
jgi:hypothetical protein